MKNAAMPAARAWMLVAGLWMHAPYSSASSTKEPDCLKGKQAELVRASNLYSAVLTALQGPQCASVGKVLAQLQSAKAPGGRKLHEGKPLDRAAAQAELHKARSDPEFAGKLAVASTGVTDATARLVVEAALLDDDGYFAARQLLIEDVVKVQEAR